MFSFDRHVPIGQFERDRRSAYLRWCETGLAEPALDERLTLKLTKLRKLTWRVERRHMRQVLRGSLACSLG